MDLVRTLTRIASQIEGKAKTARAVKPKEILVGKNVRMSWTEHSYTASSIKIQELPQKPLKRQLDTAVYSSDNPKHYHPNFRNMQGHEKPRVSFGWLFGAEEVWKRAKFSKGMDYSQALAALNKAVDSVIADAEKYIREAARKEPLMTYQKKPVQKRDMEKALNRISLIAKQSISTRVTHYLQVEPADYEPITIKGIGIVGTFEWTKFDFSPTDDPTANPMEGMRSFYTSKSPAAARKLYKIIKPDPKKIEQMSENEFLDMLNKKKVAVKYVPTSWR
tara:strand:+ start:1509 stop:2339 length:831 start_codon:yes stop_codon:yes gene_type:complete